MGQGWVRELRTPYTPEELKELDGVTRVARRLGVFDEALARLERTIHDDLDAVHGGVGWWRHGDPADLRLFVGDYLYQAAVSIQRNFIEAKIHLLDAAEAWDLESDLVRRGTFDYRANRFFPMPRSPADDLPGPLADAHAAGFFRAIGSAFDCLAACVVAVTPFPISMRGVTWTTVKARMEKEVTNRPTKAEGTTARLVLEMLERSGPPDWTAWAVSIRNMLVHHPRRINARFVLPAGPEISLPHAAPHQPTKVVPLLQRRPSSSEVEEWLSNQRSIDIVLHEPATETMSGILKHSLSLHRGVARHLIDRWQQRRAAPTKPVQPLERQWPPTARSRDTLRFNGFNPRDFEDAAPRSISTSDADARRIDAVVALRNDAPWRRR